MNSSTPSPQAVRRVRIGTTKAAVRSLTGSTQRVALARGFEFCWDYPPASGIAFVCFRHDLVAFKTGPGTDRKELQALNRAAAATSGTSG